MTTILADLGGTHLRLAFSDKPAAIKKYVIADYPDIQTVLKNFAPKIENLYLAAAIHPRGGKIEDKRFGDKSHWVIDIDGLKSDLGIENIYIYNDLDSAAYGILCLTHETTTQILKPKNNSAHFINPPKLIIGIGTGIGHAFLFEQKPGNAFVQRSHGGHMLPSAITQEQKDVLAKISDVKPSSRDMIVEDIVSGNGLETMMKFYSKQDSLKLFSEFLGLYCHTLVSSCGAYGGIYLTGGVMDELMGAKEFDVSSFQEFFHRPMVPVVVESIESTPIYYVREPNMPIMGLAHIAGITK